MKKSAGRSFKAALTQLTPAIVGFSALAVVAACARNPDSQNASVSDLTQQQKIELMLQHAGFSYDKTDKQNLDLARRLEGASLKLIDPGQPPTADAERLVTVQFSFLVSGQERIFTMTGDLTKKSLTTLTTEDDDAGQFSVVARCITTKCDAVAAMLVESEEASAVGGKQTSDIRTIETGSSSALGVAAVASAPASASAPAAAPVVASAPAAAASAVAKNKPVVMGQVAMIFKIPTPTGKDAVLSQAAELVAGTEYALQWSASPVVTQYEDGGTKLNVAAANANRIKAGKPSAEPKAPPAQSSDQAPTQTPAQTQDTSAATLGQSASAGVQTPQASMGASGSAPTAAAGVTTPKGADASGVVQAAIASGVQAAPIAQQ